MNIKEEQERSNSTEVLAHVRMETCTGFLRGFVTELLGESRLGFRKGMV